MIFHITGPSGAGKTTLGQMLAKLPNTMVIELDDIDDKNVLSLIENKTKMPANLRQLKDKMNNRDIKKIIDSYYKNEKIDHLIFTGLTIEVPEYDYGYYINIDKKIWYERLVNREYNMFKKCSPQYFEMINKGVDPDIITAIILHKYKVRHCLPILACAYDRKVPKGYKKMSSNDIYKDIVKKMK